MDKKRILVCGANGQLGMEIRDVSNKFTNLEFVFTSREELDIISLEDVSKYVSSGNFHCVVNCAAYTNVDACEDDGREKCHKVNVEGALNLLEACKENDTWLVHVSSDYVFDGTSNTPYKETDETRPLSEYGRSKECVEKEMMESYGKVMVIRTSWLYSKYGKNFMKTMLRLFNEKDEISVVFDQVGSPTWAYDLAFTICTVISRGVHGGIYHYSNEGVCSWYDFASAIRFISGSTCKIIPVHSEEFKTKAVRPRYSVLDKTKIKNDYGIQIPQWFSSLIKCMKE